MKLVLVDEFKRPKTWLWLGCQHPRQQQGKAATAFVIQFVCVDKQVSGLWFRHLWWSAAPTFSPHPSTMSPLSCLLFAVLARNSWSWCSCRLRAPCRSTKTTPKSTCETRRSFRCWLFPSPLRSPLLWLSRREKYSTSAFRVQMTVLSLPTPRRSTWIWRRVRRFRLKLRFREHCCFGSHQTLSTHRIRCMPWTQTQKKNNREGGRVRSQAVPAPFFPFLHFLADPIPLS